jgi:biopolymer transport protein ExbB/TolQ
MEAELLYMESPITMLNLLLGLPGEMLIVCLLLLILGIKVITQAVKILVNLHSEGLKNETFESEFWSGIDLSDLYANLDENHNKRGYLEDAFAQMMRTYMRNSADTSNKLLIFKMNEHSACVVKHYADDKLSYKINSLQNSVMQINLVTAIFCLYLTFGVLESELFLNLEFSHSVVMAFPAFLGLLISLLARVFIAFISYKVALVSNKVHLFIEEFWQIVNRHIAKDSNDA